MNIFILGLALFLSCFNRYETTLLQVDEERIDDFIEEFLECLEIPGLSLALVQDGENLMTKGYGVADLESGENVNSETLFNIASITKGFVSLLLTKLLNQTEGVSWSTPASEISNDLYLSDGYRTNYTTLRDIISHRTGVPRNDYITILDQWSRTELFERIRFFAPVVPFRTELLYNNIVYVIASELAKELGGGEKEWEDLVQEMIFDPVGMTSSTFMQMAAPEYEGFAIPYIDSEGEHLQAPWELWGGARATGASSSIASNAEDMSKYLNYILDDDNNYLMNDVFHPEQVMENVRIPDPEGSIYHSSDYYSRGWVGGTMQEYYQQHHGGDYIGYHSLITVAPDLKIGIYTSMNYPDNSYQRNVLHSFIFDIVIGAEPFYNATDLCSINYPDVEFTDITQNVFRHSPVDIPKGMMANRPLVEYVGEYGNFGYGNMSIYLNDEEDLLQMTYGNNGFFDLVPLAPDDTFLLVGNTSPSDVLNLGNIYFVDADDDGTVDTCRVPTMEPLDPPIFERDLLLSDAPPPEMDGCLYP